MKEILYEGPRLRLRKAELTDLDYILRLEYQEENVKYIVPFDKLFHTKVLEGHVEESMDVLAEEIATGERVGYFLINGLKTEAKEIEWTHVVIDKKGCGYGHEAMKLLKAWSFDVLGFHRAWLDCKDYNARALHLYETVACCARASSARRSSRTGAMRISSSSACSRASTRRARRRGWSLVDDWAAGWRVPQASAGGTRGRLTCPGEGRHLPPA